MSSLKSRRQNVIGTLDFCNRPIIREWIGVHWGGGVWARRPQPLTLVSRTLVEHVTVVEEITVAMREMSEEEEMREP